MNVREVFDKAKKTWQHKASAELDRAKDRLEQTVDELADLIQNKKEKPNGLDRSQS